MSSALFDVIHLLERFHVHVTLARTRPDTVRVDATLVGQRLDIEVFEDDHVEVSRFLGHEDVQGGMPLLRAILAERLGP